jgi:uncharacterized protein (TIGR02001 family)
MQKFSHWSFSLFSAELAQLQGRSRGWCSELRRVWSRTVAELRSTKGVELKGLAMKKFILPAVFAAAVVTGAPALAADLRPVYKAPPPPVSFNPWDVAVGAAVMTDYNFRGISQSARNPSVSGYFEGRFKPTSTVEWYAGVAGYAVKLPTDPSAEIDIYGGVRLTFDKWLFDFGATYYLYPGERQVTGGLPPTFIALPNGNTTLADTDFLEFYGKVTYTFNDNFNMGFAVYGTNDYLNTGAQGIYYSGTAKYTGTALPNGWNWYVSGELAYYDLGTTDFDPIAFPAIGGWDLPSYTTWNAGLGFTYKAITVECNVLTADPGATFGGTPIAITNPAGLQSKWCGAAFIGKLSFDTTLSALK